MFDQSGTLYHLNGQKPSWMPMDILLKVTSILNVWMKLRRLHGISLKNFH